MIYIRHRDARGRGHIDWLESYHTFSFGEYQDAQWMGFSDLRVINEDIIQPARGFREHPHRGMQNN
jgi:redox-sensitive bicupin YhaK (pirin superfamily)